MRPHAPPRRVRECRPSAHFQRADPAVAREAEAVGQTRRTAVERSRHLHDNDRPIALDPAFERLRCDAILGTGFFLPGTDGVYANDVAALVPHHGVRCEAGDHRTDVVIILRLEIAMKQLGQVGFHERLPTLAGVADVMCCYAAHMARNGRHLGRKISLNVVCIFFCSSAEEIVKMMFFCRTISMMPGGLVSTSLRVGNRPFLVRNCWPSRLSM